MDVGLIWVIPGVKDLEHPASGPADPIGVIIFGEPYLIEVETHTLDNITYFILDSPVFRAQTKADPYPARMDGRRHEGGRAARPTCLPPFFVRLETRLSQLSLKDT